MLSKKLLTLLFVLTLGTHRDITSLIFATETYVRKDDEGNIVDTITTLWDTHEELILSGDCECPFPPAVQSAMEEIENSLASSLSSGKVEYIFEYNHDVTNPNYGRQLAEQMAAFDSAETPVRLIDGRLSQCIDLFYILMDQNPNRFAEEVRKPNSIVHQPISMLRDHFLNIVQSYSPLADAMNFDAPATRCFDRSSDNSHTNFLYLSGLQDTLCRTIQDAFMSTLNGESLDTIGDWIQLYKQENGVTPRGYLLMGYLTPYTDLELLTEVMLQRKPHRVVYTAGLNGKSIGQHLKNMGYTCTHSYAPETELGMSTDSNEFHQHYIQNPYILPPKELNVLPA